ncbi:MFS transporter [Caulobacter segnis]|uniref:MFS transporter n=1 Tax=Caulobacter segnis TaxID=88688 RepID=A0A2W5V8W5_9CAUL|nr:MFS transporter [Caulobacter segnis]PZR35057.1 MAG: MFS transporter [Caulobacter segnis]
MSTAPSSLAGRPAGLAQGLPLVAQAALPTVGAMLLVPLAPAIAAEIGPRPGAQYLTPLILTAPSICIALFSILAGVLGDRVGRRWPLIVAVTVYGLIGMAPLVLKDFAHVLASRVVLGLCEAVIITLSATMLADYYDGKARDRWLASISTVASLSAVVFLVLGGQIGAQYGWRAASAVYGLALLIAPAMLLLTWEPSPHRQAAAAGEAKPRFPWAHMAVTGAVTLVGSVFFYTIAIQQGIALAALGVTDPAQIGKLAAIASLANPLGTLVFWRIAQRSTPTLLAIAFALLGGAFMAMGRAESGAAFTLAAFGGLFGAGLLLPTLITWTMRGLPFAVRARGTGVWQTMFAAGQFVSGLLVPFLSRALGDGILSAFFVIGVVGLTLALTAVVLRLQSGGLEQVAQ